MRAIEINGAAIELNKQAFSWGRLAAHDLARVRSVTQFRARAATTTRTLDEQIAYRARFLTDYQNQTYSDLYLSTVTKVRNAETKASPGSSELTEAVAKNLFKLMAYKDEYEVARLYTDGAFAAKLGEQFEGDVRLKFHLAAPLLPRRDKVTGHLQKKEYGGWIIHAFRLYGWHRVRPCPAERRAGKADRRYLAMKAASRRQKADPDPPGPVAGNDPRLASKNRASAKRLKTRLETDLEIASQSQQNNP